MRHERVQAGGSFLIDAKGTIVGFDGDMERLTGWTAAEVVGRLAAARLLAEATFDPGKARETVELALVGRDGHQVDVEATVTQSAAAPNRYTVSVLRVVARAESGRPTSAGRDPLTAVAPRA